MARSVRISEEAARALAGGASEDGVNVGAYVRGLKELRSALARLARTTKSKPRNWCGQCGQKYTARACGPTHAAMAAKFMPRSRKPSKSEKRGRRRGSGTSAGGAAAESASAAVGRACPVGMMPRLDSGRWGHWTTSGVAGRPDSPSRRAGFSGRTATERRRSTARTRQRGGESSWTTAVATVMPRWRTGRMTG
jgi:hypothetical protein